MTGLVAPKVTKILMCRPLHFSVDYIINPYMKPHSVDKQKAMSQWRALVKCLKSLGIQVEIIEQKLGVPDMVFATDQGVMHKNKMLLANFRYKERQKERLYYRDWFHRHKYKTVELSNVFSFEGGDALFIDDMLIIGTGFRAGVASCEEIATTLNIDVMPLRLINPAFYHLDMAFFPLDSETAFYYPPAFSNNSKNLLKRIIPNLYAFTKFEADHYAANSFVTGNHVVVQAGIPTFNTKLKKLGKKVHEVDVGEFKKAGGGIHCMINTLKKEAYANQ